MASRAADVYYLPDHDPPVCQTASFPESIQVAHMLTYLRVVGTQERKVFTIVWSCGILWVKVYRVLRFKIFTLTEYPSDLRVGNTPP